MTGPTPTYDSKIPGCFLVGAVRNALATARYRVNAITGNLLGAMYGVDAIPERSLAPLATRPIIEHVARDLHACVGGAGDSPGETSTHA